MFEQFLKYVAGEARMILDAPLAFIASVLAMTGLVYAAMRWRYGRVISHLEERVKFRDDRLAEYREKLHTGSPDEAKAKIDALENRLAQLQPRRLTDQQRCRLRDVARDAGNPYSIQIAYDVGCPDGQVFSGDFRAAFANAGWRVTRTAVLGGREVPTSGRGLQVADTKKLTSAELVVHNALVQAGIPHNVLLGGRHEDDVRLLVTAAASADYWAASI